MNGVIYARYSSDDQREESIEGQLREWMAFAESKGINILSSYIDRALSAKTDNLPQFQPSYTAASCSDRRADIVLDAQIPHNRYFG